MCLKAIIFKVFTLLCIMVLITFSMGTRANAAALVLNDQEGEKGSTVTYKVFVNSAPNEVAALGFEIRYDPHVLNYRAHAAGYLVSGFDFFDANNASPGTVKVGGFVAGAGKIGQGDSGTMVHLTFEVVGHDDCKVWLAQLKDDIKTWSTQPARFTGDHAVEQEYVDNPESPPAASSIRNPENDTGNNRIDDFDKPVYSNTVIAESNPAFSREDFRTAATESVRARPDAEKPREAGIFRQKRKKAKLKQKQEILTNSKDRSKPNQTVADVDKTLADSHTKPQVIPLNNIYSEKAGTDGWQALFRMMMFYALLYYLAIGCAIVLAGYFFCELVQMTRRRFVEG